MRFRFPVSLWTLAMLAIPQAHALVFVAQPQEPLDTGEAIFRPVADLLTRETGHPWTYQHPDNHLNYADMIVEDRAELYLSDPHFVGYQLESNRQRVLARLPDQQWVLIAPQSSTGKLLGSRAAASFSCVEATTCALPPPDLGMLLFFNMEVFAYNPLRQPMLVSVDDAANVVQGVLNESCYCGVTRRGLLRNVPEGDRQQLAVRELQTTPGAAFTVSDRVSTALASQIQAALLSPAGAEATQAMRDRLYGGADLLEPDDPEAYANSSNLLIEEFLVPMNRLSRLGVKKTGTEGMVTVATASQRGRRPVQLTVVSWGGAYSASQWKAYHEPYMKRYPNVTIAEEESSAEGLKLLREQIKSGNVRWDIVDMTASNAIAACKEGLVMEIPHDEWLAAAPDGAPPTKDFGDMIVTQCLIPQIVFSTAFGYRHDLLPQPPDSITDVFNLDDFPRARSLEKKPINNLEWALIGTVCPPTRSTTSSIRQKAWSAPLPSLTASKTT